VTAAVPDSGEPGSARKQELLEAAYRYVLANGLADMSLRPLAKAIGSSPRVLLFLFGSKEGLIRALLARAREDELGYLEQLRGARGNRDGLGGAGREVWSWLAAPAHRALLALWVEGYARSLLGEPGPWAEFGRDTVGDWLRLLAERQPVQRRTTQAGEAERTLLLAVLRGALLDLLATGDAGRVTRAVEQHLRTLGRARGRNRAGSGVIGDRQVTGAGNPTAVRS
jgi:AcrR family transcriptional regulator